MPELFRITTDRVTLQWGAPNKPAVDVHGMEAPVGRFEVLPLRRGSDPVVHREGFLFGRLHEETRYSIFLSSDFGEVTLAHEDPSLVAEVLHAPHGRSLSCAINFRSDVGFSRFRVFVNQEPEFDFIVEVFPSKLDYANDFADLLSDTQDFLTGLALEYLAATRTLGMGRPSTRVTHVEWLSMLRLIVDRLETAMRQLARQPIRSLRREPRRVAFERVRRGDALVRRVLRRSVEPRVVDHRRAEMTLDTPEHRWLAEQLSRIARRLQALMRTESRRPSSPRREATLRSLRTMQGRITALQRLAPIRAASGSAPSGFASLQLIRAPGYREAYGAALLLSMSIHIHADALEVSLKDLSVLYEQWCFFTVVRTVAEATGSVEPLFRLIKTYEDGLHIRLRSGKTEAIVFRVSDDRSISVTYKPRYTSSLIAQSPDIVITIDDQGWPAATMVLDAKYRLEGSGPPEDALNVLHRYRDAILESAGSNTTPEFKRSVVQAAALFPYREREAGAFEESELWRSLQRIGIGAVPLLPHGQRYLDQWLDSLLRSGGWSLSDRVITHQSTEASWEFRRAASEPVLIAPLRRDDPEGHLAWIRERELFYTPETKDEKLLATKWVAFYEHAGDSDRGRIRYWGRVESIETQSRSEIKTPWTPVRKANERQVVFHLSDIRSGLNIVNRRGERMSTNRWSTRLAVMRARNLEELLLATEAEWRLYEHLTAAGYKVELHAPHGRSIFRIGEDDVRHAHGSRFVVANSAGSRELELEELMSRYTTRL